MDNCCENTKKHTYSKATNKNHTSKHNLKHEKTQLISDCKPIRKL